MMDQKTGRGKEWLEKLLALMNMKASVKVTEAPLYFEADVCWLVIDERDLSSQQIETLIGKGGKNIDAVQYLANVLLNIEAETEEQQAYTVEVGDYRQKRQRELREIAQKAAQKVRDTGEEAEILSLSSAERRQIHTLLKDAPDLTTESRGQEPDRRLIVKLR